MFRTQVFNHDNFFARWVFLRILWNFVVEYGFKLQPHWTGTNRCLNLDIFHNFEMEKFGKRTCFFRVRFMQSLKTRHITCDCVLSVIKCWKWTFVCTYACRLCMSVHVCVCVCVCVCVFEYIYIYIYIYITYVCNRTYVRMCVCKYSLL